MIAKTFDDQLSLMLKIMNLSSLKSIGWFLEHVEWRWLGARLRASAQCDSSSDLFHDVLPGWSCSGGVLSLGVDFVCWKSTEIVALDVEVGVFNLVCGDLIVMVPAHGVNSRVNMPERPCPTLLRSSLRSMELFIVHGAAQQCLGSGARCLTCNVASGSAACDVAISNSA